MKITELVTGVDGHEPTPEEALEALTSSLLESMPETKVLVALRLLDEAIDEVDWCFKLRSLGKPAKEWINMMELIWVENQYRCN